MTGFFKLGEAVVWVLTASGVVRTQRGIITEVVPPGERPTGIKRGMVRDHESYAVTANGTLYWPTVDALAPAPELR